MKLTVDILIYKLAECSLLGQKDLYTEYMNYPLLPPECPDKANIYNSGYGNKMDSFKKQDGYEELCIPIVRYSTDFSYKDMFNYYKHDFDITNEHGQSIGNEIILKFKEFVEYLRQRNILSKLPKEFINLAKLIDINRSRRIESYHFAYIYKAICIYLDYLLVPMESKNISMDYFKKLQTFVLKNESLYHTYDDDFHDKMKEYGIDSHPILSDDETKNGSARFYASKFNKDTYYYDRSRPFMIKFSRLFLKFFDIYKRASSKQLKEFRDEMNNNIIELFYNNINMEEPSHFVNQYEKNKFSNLKK